MKTLATFARLYIWLLLTCQIVCIVLLILICAATLTGMLKPLANYSQVIPIAALLLSAPALGLARERNV